MASIAQRFEEKGRTAGLAEGRTAGLAEGRAAGFAEGETVGRTAGLAEGETVGEAKSLSRLLQRRFGPLPPSVQSRIAEASLDELDGWVDQVLDAPSLEAMFGDINRH